MRAVTARIRAIRRATASPSPAELAISRHDCLARTCARVKRLFRAWFVWSTRARTTRAHCAPKFPNSFARSLYLYLLRSAAFCCVTVRYRALPKRLYVLDFVVFGEIASRCDPMCCAASPCVPSFVGGWFDCLSRELRHRASLRVTLRHGDFNRLILVSFPPSARWLYLESRVITREPSGDLKMHRCRMVRSGDPADRVSGAD